MSENKKVAVMLTITITIILSMSLALYIVKPCIISSDNKLIQECLAKKIDCSIHIDPVYGTSYGVDVDGFERRRIETAQEALEFIKKVENFNK